MVPYPPESIDIWIQLWPVPWSFILWFSKAHCNPVQSFKIINYIQIYPFWLLLCLLGGAYSLCLCFLHSLSRCVNQLSKRYHGLTSFFPFLVKIPQVWKHRASWVGKAGWCLSLFISGLLELRLTRVFLLFLMIFLESLINTVSSGGKGRVAASKLLQ